MVVVESDEARRFKSSAEREDSAVPEDQAQGRVAALGSTVPKFHFDECGRVSRLHRTPAAQEHRAPEFRRQRRGLSDQILLSRQTLAGK